MRVMIDRDLQAELAPCHRGRCMAMVRMLIDLLRDQGLEATAHYDVVVRDVDASGLMEITSTDDEGLTAAVLFRIHGDVIIVTMVGGCVPDMSGYHVSIPRAEARWLRFLAVAKEFKL